MTETKNAPTIFSSEIIKGENVKFPNKKENPINQNDYDLNEIIESINVKASVQNNKDFDMSKFDIGKIKDIDFSGNPFKTIPIDSNVINDSLQTNKVPSMTISKKFHYMSLEELIERSKNEPLIANIWSGIKEGSIGFIFGPSKSGKTTFCENLAMSLAAGEPFFFNIPIMGGARKVLFISMEEFWQPRTERNSRQMNELKSPLNNNYNIVNEYFPRLIDSPEDWKLLAEHIIESGATVVLIDSLSRMYSGSIEDSKLAKQLLYRLRELSNMLKITLIIVHHTPKQSGRPLSIDSLAGSRMLAQEADFMIGINKTLGGKRYFKEVAFRYAPENDETVTTFKINENSWIYPIDEEIEASLLKNDGRNDNSSADLVLEHIKTLANEIGLAETKDLSKSLVETGLMSKPTLHMNINKLIKDGKIEKKEKGHYQVKE